MQQQVDPML